MYKIFKYSVNKAYLDKKGLKSNLTLEKCEYICRHFDILVAIIIFVEIQFLFFYFSKVLKKNNIRCFHTVFSAQRVLQAVKMLSRREYKTIVCLYKIVSAIDFFPFEINNEDKVQSNIKFKTKIRIVIL